VIELFEGYVPWQEDPLRSVTIRDAESSGLASGDYPLIPLTIPAIFEMSASCCLETADNHPVIELLVPPDAAAYNLVAARLFSEGP
jgi:hypothetical protein